MDADQLETVQAFPADRVEPLRIGVIGTARITKRIVAEMQATSGIEVSAIASRDRARASWYAQQYGISRAWGDYESLLNDPEIDAVYLPLPPALHYRWVLAAFDAKKHVLCEKPLVCNLSELEALEIAASANGVVWMDATAWLHHERTDAMYQIASDSLGNIRHVAAAVSFYEPFQTDEHRLSAELGGGCLLDLGWYAAGVWAWIFHELPSSVQAFGQRAEAGTWRSVTGMAQWPHGATATLHCAYHTSTRKWFEIAGDQRSLICDDFTRPWNDRPARYWLHDRSGKVDRAEFTGNQEIRMLQHFRETVLGLRPPSLAWDQARRTQQILEMLETALS